MVRLQVMGFTLAYNFLTHERWADLQGFDVRLSKAYDQTG